MHIAVEAMILIINTGACRYTGEILFSIFFFLLSLSLSLLSRLFCFHVSLAFSHSVSTAASRRLVGETATPLMARVQRQEYRFNELWDVQ